MDASVNGISHYCFTSPEDVVPNRWRSANDGKPVDYYLWFALQEYWMAYEARKKGEESAFNTMFPESTSHNTYRKH